MWTQLHCSYSCYVFIGGNVVEIKMEADSNDITECSHDDELSKSMSCFVSDLIEYELHCIVVMKLWRKMQYKSPCRVYVGYNSMEIKTEVDDDFTESQHDDKPSVGMHDFLLCSPKLLISPSHFFNLG